MNLDDAIKLMARTDGYTLWVGAGATIQLARAGGGNVPGWAALCLHLEQLAAIGCGGGDYPTRLDACLNVLGRERFQREVREAILHPLCDAVLAAARTHSDPDNCVPKALKQLASLAALADPIVNFNIETLTSTALAYAGGPYAVRAFVPPLDELKGLPRPSAGSSDGQRGRRPVYHVHGALEAGGVCVLSKSEYSSMDGTLALQLASHAAFASRLFIVGMSLDDEYLRLQLKQFMPQLNGVYWFVDSSVRSDLLGWAAKAGVETVDVGTWNQFWSIVEMRLPTPSQLRAVLAWLHVVSQAADSRSPAARSWIVAGLRSLGAAEPELERWRRLAALAGLSSDPIDEAEARAYESRKQALIAPLLKAIDKLARNAPAA